VNTNTLVEILTPSQSDEEFEKALETFAERYRTALDRDFVVSVPDNPMGIVHFQLTDIITELGLPVKADQVLMHVNTCHRKQDLDAALKTAQAIGIRNLLVVTGDGSERLPKLKPEALGMAANAVTSVELLQYVHREFPGVFHTGVAFNQYEPHEHEMEKMQRKIAAGAAFVITQPYINDGNGHSDLTFLSQFHLPVALGVWMSRKLHLLAECVGYPIPEDTAYDPMTNLDYAHHRYPGWSLYLALLGFKTQLPLVKSLLN
jgi:methylenetetrahydrofolate reductase (NADPH)